MIPTRPEHVITLKQALEMAERHHYATGAFSPRMTPLIAAVLRAGERMQSPVIVQISSNEFRRYGVTPGEFGAVFYEELRRENTTVPVVLHLDHTKDLDTIARAIDAGFTSVMIDASEKPFEDNVRITKEVVDYARSRGVSVEAELGMIGTTDFVETDRDEELYTDPREAAEFVLRTGVDALAVSCGTAHGVYMVREPKVDYDRLMNIRALTDVHLVLHGGSGVPEAMMIQAFRLPKGGVSKVNIATDLELAFLHSLRREERMSNEACKALSASELAVARDAVEAAVREKISSFLLSEGMAKHFRCWKRGA